jgi:hypothetical protein
MNNNKKILTYLNLRVNIFVLKKNAIDRIDVKIGNEYVECFKLKNRTH